MSVIISSGSLICNECLLFYVSSTIWIGQFNTTTGDVGSIRNLYSSQDLYEAVASLRDPDYSVHRSVVFGSLLSLLSVARPNDQTVITQRVTRDESGIRGTRLLFKSAFLNVSRLEEKWNAVKVPLTVPSFEDLVSYRFDPNGVSFPYQNPFRPVVGFAWVFFLFFVQFIIFCQSVRTGHDR